MLEVLEQPAADPGRVHQESLDLRHRLEVARQQVAGLLAARASEVVFTASASEALVSAIWGATEVDPGIVIVPASEHAAVRHAAERTGRARTVGIDRHGRVDPDEILDLVDTTQAAGRSVALVACQLGNHETGATQPVADLATALADRKVRFLVDGAQAVGRVPIDVRAQNIGLLALSGHKLGGPAGSGALVVRRGTRLPPLIVGGDQERARRAGLENVAAAAGLGAACAEIADTFPAERDRALAHTERIRRLLDDIDGVTIVGPPEPTHRLPHIVCFVIADIAPQAVVLELDRAGVAIHSGSACASEGLEPSPILAAMGVDADHALRVSVGWDTPDAAIDRLQEVLPTTVTGLRRLRSG